MPLPKELIALGQNPADKCAAITLAAKLLSDHGKIEPAYLQGMLTRETQENTYLGKGVAIPHGTPETRHLIHETAIAVVQIPAGISWGEKNEPVQLVVAIAADGDEHLQLLRRLTRILADDEQVTLLKTTTDPEVIQQLLNGETVKDGETGTAENCTSAPSGALETEENNKTAAENNHQNNETAENSARPLPESAAENCTSAPSDALEETEENNKTAAENDHQNGETAENSARPLPESAKTSEIGTAEKIALSVTIPNPLGLHARPATRLTKLARTLSADVFLRTENGERASARELMELLALGLSKGQKILVESDSEEAAEQIAQAIAAGLGDQLTPAPVALNLQTSHATIWTPSENLPSLTGIAASDGLAYGNIYRYEQHRFQISDASRDPYEEAVALDWAIAEAARAIYATMETVSQQMSSKKAAVFNAHLAMLNDETIISDTANRIAAGENAALAYKTVLDNRIAVFETQPSAQLAARSADLRDVREQVLKHLLGIEAQLPNFPPNAILCAEHLTPALIAHLPRERIFGIITASGNPSDHNAIIARGMGLPMIVGIGADIAQLQDGDKIILDGNAGNIYLRPSEEQLQSAARAKEEMQKWLEQALVSRMQPGHTADGKKIDILANINHASVASAALDNGAEGVGLMRTESLFLKRDTPPSEEEQTAEYLAMAKSLGDRPLIIRTLDIGDQKRPAYLSTNQPLGASPFPLRGIGLGLKNPNWLIPQLRAICRARCESAQIKVMFPMVTTFNEWQAAKALLEEIRAEIGAPALEVGAMIEMPSAALLAPQLAAEVDFFSIGTNDLSRYTLSSQVGHDALHPAVLRLIDFTIRAAKLRAKPVSICGTAAGDVCAAKIFAGLGVDALSVRPPQIAMIKQALRESSSVQLAKLAHQALSLPDAGAVRQLVAQAS